MRVYFTTALGNCIQPRGKIPCCVEERERVGFGPIGVSSDDPPACDGQEMPEPVMVCTERPPMKMLVWVKIGKREGNMLT